MCLSQSFESEVQEEGFWLWVPACVSGTMEGHSLSERSLRWKFRCSGI
jgi:hypothetical protein